MPIRPPLHRPNGARSQRDREHDQKRGSAAERGYGLRWRKARAMFLAAHPTCIRCGAPASVVDHIRPHRGNHALFWDRANWQPLCAPCHNSGKQREEGRGHMLGSGPDGRPRDPEHPWNRGR